MGLPRTAVKAIYGRYGLTCPICGRRFKALGGLVWHVMSAHPGFTRALVAAESAASRAWCSGEARRRLRLIYQYCAELSVCCSRG